MYDSHQVGVADLDSQLCLAVIERLALSIRSWQMRPETGSNASGAGLGRP